MTLDMEPPGGFRSPETDLQKDVCIDQNDSNHDALHVMYCQYKPNVLIRIPDCPSNDSISIFVLTVPQIIDTKDTLLCFTSNFRALRLHGGAPALSTQFDGNLFSIDSLDQRRFRWNGLPAVEANEHILGPFRAGLSQVGDGKGNLYQTAERKDPGGTLGTPPAASLNPANAADAVIITEHELRKLKLFGILCNYTDSRSEAYRHFMRDFDSDGIAVWEFIKVYVVLPVPDRYTRAREENWKNLSYDKLKLPYTISGYFKYVEHIQHHAFKLNKSCNAQKEKFISGLPDFMRHSQTHMRNSNFVFQGGLGRGA